MRGIHKYVAIWRCGSNREQEKMLTSDEYAIQWAAGHALDKSRRAGLPVEAVLGPSIRYLGPVAEHDMPCAVCRQRHAVLMLNTGTFHPCWECQKFGWQLIHNPQKEIA